MKSSVPEMDQSGLVDWRGCGRVSFGGGFGMVLGMTYDIDVEYHGWETANLAPHVCRGSRFQGPLLPTRRFDYRIIASDLRHMLDKRLDTANITIAFPQPDLQPDHG